jgi:hypothetical protein
MGAHISFANPLFFGIVSFMNNVWPEIIGDALRLHIDKTHSAAPGAKLRAAVAQLAKSRGLDFPPPGMGKFSEFVESFQTEFIVDRPAGGDILVVPASRPELLAAKNTTSGSNRARVRQDLFEALTRIPLDSYGLPYYDPNTDAVTYIKTNDPVPSSLVKLPATSLDQELELRQQFVADLREVFAKGNTPLRDFSQTVQSFGLGQQWHVFRMGLLATRLRTWSVEKAIQWQQSWVKSLESRTANTPTFAAPVGADDKKYLVELASMLTEEDLSRITIPMDIVIRLISKK